MTERALLTKALVICARSKENPRTARVFLIFMTSAWPKKSILTVDFLAFPSGGGRKGEREGGERGVYEVPLFKWPS